MKEKLNILIPVDFSTAALNAIENTARFMELIDAKIFLLHVVDNPIPATDIPYTKLENEVSTKRKNAQYELEALIDGLKNRNADFRILIDEGRKSKKIEEIINRMNIDLLIIGKKDVNEITKYLYERTSDSLLHNAKCPVVIIPEDVKVNKIKSIVYASNLLYEDINPLQILINIAQVFDAKITILHMFKEWEMNKEKWVDYKKGVLKVINYPKLDFKEIQGEKYAETINDYLVKENTDMLAMLTIKRGLFEFLYNPSTTENMSYHLDIPLLVFHNHK